jgi:hypothetical protein
VRHVPYGGLVEPLLYLGIVVFNLTITFWIGETLLGLLGCLVFAPVVALFLSHPLNPMRHAGRAEVERHRHDFPPRRSRSRASPHGGHDEGMDSRRRSPSPSRRPRLALTGREVIDDAQKKHGFSTWHDRVMEIVMESYTTTLQRTREATVTEQTHPRGEHRTFMEFTAPSDATGRSSSISRRAARRTSSGCGPPRRGRPAASPTPRATRTSWGRILSYRDLELIVRIQQWNDDESTATLEADETLDGKPCHVVSLVPKSNEEFPYSRYKLWFGTADALLWQVEVYDLEKRLFKRVKMDRYERIQNYATARGSDVANVPVQHPHEVRGAPGALRQRRLRRHVHRREHPRKKQARRTAQRAFFRQPCYLAFTARAWRSARGGSGRRGTARCSPMLALARNMTCWSELHVTYSQPSGPKLSRPASGAVTDP